MAQQKVELRKVRDFSDILNDTFQFLKQNVKPLLTCVVAIAGIFILTTAILSGIQQSESVNIFQDIFRGRRSSATYEIFTGLYFFVILFVWLTINALQVVVIAYMKVYEEKENKTPTFEEVWYLFKNHFLRVTFYNIPIFILITIGSVLCLVPGIYLAVVFAIFSSILIIEDESFGNAFNRCFTLIKDNFWLSLGSYFVVMLASYFASAIISVVIGLISGIIAYFTTDDLAAAIGVITSILNVFGFIFYLLLFITITLNYYNLVEQYDGIGMQRRLQGLGNDQPPTAFNSNIEEEY